MKLKDSLSPIEGKNTELMEIVAKLKRKINYLEKKVIVELKKEIEGKDVEIGLVKEMLNSIKTMVKVK